jgi:hypothetical protein
MSVVYWASFDLIKGFKGAVIGGGHRPERNRGDWVAFIIQVFNNIAFSAPIVLITNSLSTPSKKSRY